MTNPLDQFNELIKQLDTIALSKGTNRLELCSEIQRYPEEIFDQVIKILNTQVQLLVRIEQIRKDAHKFLPSVR